jgi:RNA polymerase sigma-70 factor (ECF subfamily)
VNTSLRAVPKESTSIGLGGGDAAANHVQSPGESAALTDDYGRILRYVRSLVRDPMEAEDLTQETFLRAYRAREELRDQEARIAWLYSIATHVCVDRLRQRKRRPGEPGSALEETESVDAGPLLQQLVEQGEMGECVQRYVDHLSDEYRAVLLLHDQHELTNPQIAELLGISLATVKIRLHRARRKLRASLEGGCAFSHDERNVLVCEPRA